MSPTFHKSTVYGDDFLDLCAKNKRGEIKIHSISVGSSPAEWVVQWSEVVKPVVQRELLK